MTTQNKIPTHCPSCGTALSNARGLGPFCPNMSCSKYDNILDRRKVTPLQVVLRMLKEFGKTAIGVVVLYGSVAVLIITIMFLYHLYQSLSYEQTHLYGVIPVIKKLSGYVVITFITYILYGSIKKKYNNIKKDLEKQ